MDYPGSHGPPAPKETEDRGCEAKARCYFRKRSVLDFRPEHSSSPMSGNRLRISFAGSVDLNAECFEKVSSAKIARRRAIWPIPGGPNLSNGHRRIVKAHLNRPSGYARILDRFDQSTRCRTCSVDFVCNNCIGALFGWLDGGYFFNGCIKWKRTRIWLLYATAMFAACCCGGGRERRLRLVEGEALGEDGVITALEAFEHAGLERDAAVARAVGHPRGAAQQPLHLACPVFLLDVDQGLEFAQVMGIAESMEHSRHRIVGLPVVVHDRADDIRQQAAAPGADAIEGQRGS